MNKQKSQITVDKLLDLSLDIDLWIWGHLLGRVLGCLETLCLDLQDLKDGYDIKFII
jgi:hypothetical protein